MFVQRFDAAKAEKAYGILCQKLYPQPFAETSVLPQPFGSTYCEIEAGGSTAPHHHYDGETFLILEGRGRMRIAEETREVSAGDVILIPPHSAHTLTNLSATERLKFVSVYYESRGRAFDDQKPREIFLASAPPTPNGPLHLGHLSGPYVVADVLRRFYRLQGTTVNYVCGSDDNQSYVPAKGHKLGLSAQGVIDTFVPQITAVQEKIGAKADYFLRPHGNAEYVAFVQDFFVKLVDRGHLVLRDSEVLYCDACQAYLHEAFVKGGCPTCLLPTSGNGCEACGLTNDCIDLIDPRCSQCEAVPGRRAMKKYYFDLMPWKAKLESHLNRAALPPSFRPFAEKVLSQGLRSLSGTHPSPWGISLPPSLATDETRGQVIYEWLEMAAGYVYMAEKLSAGRGYASVLASTESRFVQCFGFDNSFFYLAFVPALLMGYDEKIMPPEAFVINFFYLLDGKKFSTSRNHAVWGQEFLMAVHPDIARYYLAATRPENGETNFSLAECAERVERRLEKQWNGLAGVLDELTALNGNRMPASPKNLLPDELAFVRRTEDALAQAAYAYRAESFALNRLATLLDNLVDDVFARAKVALALHDSARGRSERESALVFTAARTLGLIAAPLLPEMGGELFAKFEGAPPQRWLDHVEPIAEGKGFLETRLWSSRYQDALTGINGLRKR